MSWQLFGPRPVDKKFRYLFWIGLFTSAVWIGSLYLPLHSQLERIIAVAKTGEEITIRPGDVVKQIFRTNGGLYSGIIISSTSATLSDREISVRLLDKNGKELTKTYDVHTYYLPADDTLRLEFKFPWVRLPANENITEEITLKSGQPFAIKASALNDKIHPIGRLFVNNQPVPRDIAVAVLKVVPLPAGSQQGVMAGLILVVGLTLTFLFVAPKYQWWISGALLVIITPFALGGFWFSDDALGIADWDYYFSLHHYYRETIFTFHQFPLWNPWTCGGTAALGDPEFPLFTFTYLLELLFNIPVGLRLSIYLSIAVRALGMLMLARRLKFSLPAAMVAALGGAFSSVSILELVEGHVNFLAGMWIPWIFWSWLSAYQFSRRDTKQLLKEVWNKGVTSVEKAKQIGAWLIPNKWEVVCAVFLSLLFYAGGIYLLMYTLLAFIILPILVTRKLDAAFIPVRAGVVALGLVAFKLLPVLSWLKQFPDQYYTPSTVTLPWLVDIFLGRNLHGTYILFNQVTDWQEYGAYIGPFILILALLGLSRLKKSRLVRALFVGVIMVTLLSSSGPAIKYLYDYMSYFPRSTISRIIYFAVIAISLLAGIGVDVLRRKFPRAKFIPLIFIGLIGIDLMSLDYQLSQQSFVLPHVVPAVSPAPSPIAFTPMRYDEGGEGSRRTRGYDAAVQGYGVLNYCSVLGPLTSAVRTIYDEGSNGAVDVFDKNAKLDILSWTPNRITVHVVSPTTTNVVLNTNFAKGWFVNNKPAIEVSNRVGTLIEPGDSLLVFQYKPYGMWVGISITGVTLFVLIWVGRRQYKLHTHKKHSHTKTSR